MAEIRLNIELPPLLGIVADRFSTAGGSLFIVGGWLRDRLLGIKSKDIDLATDLQPAEIKRAMEGLGSIFTIGEKFGTIGVHTGEYIIEITTLRSDVYAPGSRHPEVSPAADIAEDLARRDFTINAMAVQIAPVTGPLADPFGGRADLAGKIIRTPGEPRVRMAEDPLRMMRAVRFAAQLGFSIEASLLEVLGECASLLEDISAERRRDELERIIVSPRADEGVRLLTDSGLMRYVCPEIALMKGVEQPRSYHRADVLEHTLLTMMGVRPDPLLRRSALFHDVAKPAVRVSEPKVMFPEHDRTGAEMTARAMQRLRYGNEDVGRTVFMVRRHMRPIHYEPSWTDAAVRRLVRECTLRKGDEVIVPLSAVIELARADIGAGNLEKAPMMLERVEMLEERIECLGERHVIERAHSPLDGSELMEMFGRDPGPWIKEIKAHLTGMVVDGDLAQDDKEQAKKEALSFDGRD
jgi:poly(A) polymerase